MIVEFIGSTGAGKTTLIKHILDSCEKERIDAVMGTDFVLERSHLHGIKNRLIQAALINLVSVYTALAAWRSNLDFYRFAFRILLNLPDTVPWLERIWMAKNILKRFGIYEVIRRHGVDHQVYLVDEGTLHVAHSLFVQLAGEADRRDIATFAGIVPLPQVVVYLRQDEALLVERLLARGHPRVPDHSVADAVHFVRQATTVFDELVQIPAVQQKVVLVDGAQMNVMSPSVGNHPLLTSAAKLVEAGLQVSAKVSPAERDTLPAQGNLPMHREITTSATLIDSLIDTLNREEIVYCHWKSNIDLAQATAGMLDLDLLVDRASLSQAHMILAHLGFKAAVARWGANPPGIRHYYGLDPDTQQLIHVHLFSRVLTGESFVKSHLFPFEVMLLENTYQSGRIKVTSKPAELVLFTLRMFVKYGSLFDLLVLRRKSKSIKTEIRWLQDGNDLSEALSLLRNYCPVIDDQLFVTCVKTLNSDSSLITRMILAGRVRRRLMVYAKHTFFQRLWAYGQLLWAEVQRRLGAKQQNKVLQAGGAVIAFVGADATGKSTLVTETGRWLGDTFAVKVIHTGKPPSTWLTAPANLALAFIRKRSDSQSVGHFTNQKTFSTDSNLAQHSFKGLASILYAMRALVLAWDRQQLILKSRRRAAEGEIIVCDRYPSNITGAMDSPCLVEESRKSGPVVAIYNRLVQLEKQLYRRIPPPDIVLRLKVSLETALQRNRARNGQDKEVYLEARHRQSQQWQMPGTGSIYAIDTEQTLEETIRTVKEAVWKSL